MCMRGLSGTVCKSNITYCVNVAFLRRLGPNLLRNIKNNLSTVVNASTLIQQDDEQRSSYKEESVSPSNYLATESKKKKKKYSEKHIEDLLNYFALNKDFKSVYQKLPNKLLQHKRSTPESVYLLDPGIAKNIVNIIKPYFKNKTLPVLEVNPGFGYITRELQDAGVSKLRLFEPVSVFVPYLKRIQRNYVSEIDIIKKDFLQLAKYTFQDKQDMGKRIDNLFNNIEFKKWKEEPVMRIIGALPSLIFIKQLIMNHVMQTGIMAFGRPEMFLLMSPMLYTHLTCSPEAGYLQYRSSTVLFQLIFNLYLLDKVPRKAFVPWEIIEKTKKFAKVCKIDPEYLYLVRIVPNEDFFEQVVSAEHLRPLWYFIRHHLNSRTNRVIPCLEKWIPGCGPRLIVEGLDIHKQFGDLAPVEILNIFKKFISWPEYNLSSFPASMENFFLKAEISEDTTKDIDEGAASVEDEDDEF